jgi:murein L,D-transpeptidase YcbB/YkuD
MRYLSALHVGRVDPREVGFDYDVSHKQLDLALVLRQSRGAGGLEKAKQAAEPPFPVYHRLVKALSDYRAIAAAGEPPLVPALDKKQKKVVPGAAWEGATALAARLRALRDLPAEAALPPPAADGTPLYAGELVLAVKRFQERHLLEPDGVIGAGTIAALDVPVARRVRQIELALERERWLPEILKQPLVFVNVSLFRLWGYDPDKPDEPLRMNVVVGKSLGHATPVFVDQMEYIIFRPYWSPPPSIVKDEILPRARRDPGYLDREQMEIVASGDERAPALPATPANLDAVAAGRLYVRQKPGEKNSLGLAKFIFPNSENVYMHGTPAQSLFARARRDFSHGCIRLENPAALAQWVLRDDAAWTKERIAAAMNGDRPTQVNLKQKLTVILFYDTAYVGNSGRVRFSDDIYGHDAKLEAALQRGYPYRSK